MRAFLALTAAVLVSIGIGLGLLDAAGHTTTTGSIILLGNGIDEARFGQTESVAIANLQLLLGRSDGPAQRQNEGGCGTYDLLTWKDVQAFFMNGRLVGYNTGYTRSKNDSTFTTARGLHIGDTIAEAQRIYGTAFTTSSAQGGSWSVITATGRLIGLLTNPPVPTGPSDRIASFAAGYVGCPATTP